MIDEDFVRHTYCNMAVLDSKELSDATRAIILDENNEIYYSAASVWDITIKHMAHPETFLYSGKHLAKGCEANDFISLPIINKHSAELETLTRAKDAPLHKEPFDRILRIRLLIQRFRKDCKPSFGRRSDSLNL